MTIAACHLSPEGVVLGSDSTTTILDPDGRNRAYLDYAQKLFEVGPRKSSLALATWGMGQVAGDSHRTIAAFLGKRHQSQPFKSVADAAAELSKLVWSRYQAAYSQEQGKSKDLFLKFQQATLSPAELEELQEFGARLSGGYCLAGRTDKCGRCEAYEIQWTPWYDVPAITDLKQETPYFWGVPAIMERVIYGFDNAGLLRILQSGKWNGTSDELYNLIAQNRFMQPAHLPIREAIDWIHTIIHTTIRGVKFAQESHSCGGPVEIACITTDRPFRWVCHKGLGAAIVTSQEATA